MTKKFKSNISEITLCYKQKVRAQDRPEASSSELAYRLFRDNWDDLTINLYEEFKILLLDRSNKCMGIVVINRGGVSSTYVDTKLLFAAAIKSRASSIILGHNHPSGCLMPSMADLALTQKIIDGGKLLDLNVLDHIIVTDTHYSSMADAGLGGFK